MDREFGASIFLNEFPLNANTRRIVICPISNKARHSQNDICLLELDADNMHTKLPRIAAYVILPIVRECPLFDTRDQQNLNVSTNSDRTVIAMQQ
jgi:hypothetical protein